jgi:hypothetical protein
LSSAWYPVGSLVNSKCFTFLANNARCLKVLTRFAKALSAPVLRKYTNVDRKSDG